MKVPRELIWIPILIAVLVLALFGCSDLTEEQYIEELKAETKLIEQAEADIGFIAGRELYYAKHFTEIEYKGHTYIYYSRNERMGLTHAAHCKARHR